MNYHALKGKVLTVNKEVAFALFKLVNIITEKMISEEKQIDEIYDSLPEDKLKQINQRDNN